MWEESTAKSSSETVGRGYKRLKRRRAVIDFLEVVFSCFSQMRYRVLHCFVSMKLVYININIITVNLCPQLALTHYLFTKRCISVKENMNILPHILVFKLYTFSNVNMTVVRNVYVRATLLTLNVGNFYAIWNLCVPDWWEMNYSSTILS